MSKDVFFFLHVAFVDIPLTKEMTSALEATFNKSNDWIRYSPTCWIVRTKQSAATWNRRIKATQSLPADAGFLIAPIELTLGAIDGWLPEFVWDWITKFNSPS